MAAAPLSSTKPYSSSEAANRAKMTMASSIAKLRSRGGHDQREEATDKARRRQCDGNAMATAMAAPAQSTPGACLHPLQKVIAHVLGWATQSPNAIPTCTSGPVSRTLSKARQQSHDLMFVPQFKEMMGGMAARVGRSVGEPGAPSISAGLGTLSIDASWLRCASEQAGRHSAKGGSDAPLRCAK